MRTKMRFTLLCLFVTQGFASNSQDVFWGPDWIRMTEYDSAGNVQRDFTRVQTETGYDQILDYGENNIRPERWVFIKNSEGKIIQETLYRDSLARYSIDFQVGQSGFIERIDYNSAILGGGFSSSWGIFEESNGAILFERDESGNEIKMTNLDDNGIVQDYKTSKYDSRGYKTNEFFFNSSGTRLNSVNYIYDGYGRLTLKSSSSSSVRTAWEYNENGDTTKITQTAGTLILEWTEFEYDELKRLTKTSRFDSTGAIVISFLHEYDFEGSLIKESRFAGDTALSEYKTFEYPVLTVKTETENFKASLKPGIRFSPNPFRDVTEILLQGQSYPATLFIFSPQGKKVKAFRLKEGERVVWKPGNLPNGVYFVNVVANGKKFSQKVILTK